MKLPVAKGGICTVAKGGGGAIRSEKICLLLVGPRPLNAVCASPPKQFLLTYFWAGLQWPLGPLGPIPAIQLTADVVKGV